MNTLDRLLSPRLSARAALRYDHVRQTHLLLLPERVVRLNRTAAAVLGRCDGSRTVADLIAELRAQYGGVDLGRDVRAFLREARAKGWVV